MKRDVKRLGRLVRVRRVQEEQTRIEWQRAELTARAREDEAEAMSEARRRAIAELGLPEAPRAPSWLIAQHRWIDSMDAAIRASVNEARRTRALAEAARAPWQVCRRSALGMERLHDNARQNARAEELAADTAHMDEVAVSRAAARRREDEGKL